MSLRPRPVLLLLVFAAALTLLWFPYQSHYKTLAPPPATNTNDGTVAKPVFITNNNVTYPRLEPKSLTPTQARTYIDRLHRINNTIFQPADHPVGQENHAHLDRLLSHLETIETHGGVAPTVVLTSWHWMPCTYGPCTTGEVQWIRPLIELMKESGVFFFFSPVEHFNAEFALLGNDLVTHAWVDDEDLLRCVVNPKTCLQSEENPGGVQLWKLFAFTFWGSKPNMLKWTSPSRPWSFNPLGSEWTLVPYRMPDRQFHLGYHYQSCDSVPFIPHSERKNQIVILAKLSNYFHQWPAYDPKTFYVKLREALGEGWEILSNADEEAGFPIPDGVKSLGLLPPDEYDLQLSGAKVLLGIGKPILSPTPYASLCRGVPVILPFKSSYYEKSCVAQPDSSVEYCGFDEDVHQHGPAAEIGEPYVYTVDTAPGASVDAIISTIKRAVQTPIEPYEPEEMKREVVKARLMDYFSIDWEAYAGTKAGRTELEPFLKAWVEKNPDPPY